MSSYVDGCIAIANAVQSDPTHQDATYALTKARKKGDLYTSCFGLAEIWCTVKRNIVDFVFPQSYQKLSQAVKVRLVLPFQRRHR